MFRRLAANDANPFQPDFPGTPSMSIHLKSPGMKSQPEGSVDVPSHEVAGGAGAIGGAVAGGDALAHSSAEVSEAAHWREHFKSRPYVGAEANFEDFGPAYAFGAAQYGRYPDGTFDEVQDEMAESWYAARGQSTLAWEHASPAARDAWERRAGDRKGSSTDR